MNFKSNWVFAGISLLMLGAMGITTDGCASSAARRASKTTNQQAAPKEKSGEAEKGRAQLWAENCGQCHNNREPGSFSQSQWEVIMLHMRVRANLTAKEHQAILEFLKASN